MSASSGIDSDRQPEANHDEGLPEGQILDYFHDDNDDGENLPNDDALQPIVAPESSRKAGNPGPAVGCGSSGKPGAGTVPLLEQNIYEDQAYLPRPNKWFGAESTWLSWTEGDRQIAQAEDRIRSQDLSLHLYNAHALKANAKSSQSANRRQRKGKTPMRPGDEVSQDAGDPLVLPRGWTSWPLPPEQVPREPLIPHSTHDVVYRMEEDLRPSAVLEDCVIATTTRIARKRWEARSWQAEPGPKRQWGIKVEDDEDDVAMAEEASNASAEDSDPVETVNSDSDSASENTGGEYFVSQAYDLALDAFDEESKKSKGSLEDSVDDEAPIPIADDEKARALLLPGTRQILGKLDDLLTGLHKARQAYATGHRKKRARSPKQDTNQATDAEFEVGPTGPASRKRGRKRAVSVASSVSIMSGSADIDDEDDGKPRRWRPGPRDWSDVIGMAALTGWDPAIVERASERCASLFNQNMLLRTLHEGDVRVGQKSYFTEYHAAGDEEFDDEEEHTEDLTGLVRTSQACGECRALGQKCEAQDGAEGKSTCKRCAECFLNCSGITVKIYNDIGRTCPYKDCERSTIPFSKAYHLQRHLDTIHRHDSPLAQDSDMSVTTLAQQPPAAKQIVCPIPVCPRHKAPFSRGAKLYEHVRKMHPELDVEEVKRDVKERHGDQRGRWRDGRRRELGRANLGAYWRSRSRSRMSGARSDADD